MIPRSRRRRPAPMIRLVFLCLLSHLRTTSCRSWRDAVGPDALADDGMPRASPPRHRGAAAEAFARPRGSNATDDGAGAGQYESLTRNVEMDIHGDVTGVFDEIDVYRVTEAPSSMPSSAPSSAPSGGPSLMPSSVPSVGPSVSIEPTLYPTRSPAVEPTGRPT